MLPGITPTLWKPPSTGPAPPAARGNDANTVSLLHFRQPSGWDYVANGVWNDDRVSGGLTWGAGGNYVRQWGGVGSQFKFGGRTCLIAPSSYIIDQNTAAVTIPAASDFTVECWVCPADNSRAAGIVSKVNYGTSCGQFLIYQNGSTFLFYMSSNGSSWDLCNAQPLGSFTVGNWYHLMVVRYGSTVWGFQNGVCTFGISIGANPYSSTSDKLCLGMHYYSTGPSFWYGWIDEFRLSNIARRTSAATFTPPNEPYVGSPVGNDDGTVLHMDCEGANAGTVFSEDSRGGLGPKAIINYQNVHTYTGNPNVKFGSSGAVFGETANNLLYPGYGGIYNITDFDFRSANFTIDFWYNRYGAAGQNHTLIQKRLYTANLSPFGIFDNGVNIVLYMSQGSAWDISGRAIATSPAANVWVHFALVRNGNQFTTYINGVQTDTFSWAGVLFVNNDYLTIGSSVDGASGQVRMDEIRISKIARWTANFTPPSAGYGASNQPANPSWPAERFLPQPPYTKLLLHFDGIAGATSTSDSSNYGHATYLANGASLYDKGGGGGRFGTTCLGTFGSPQYCYVANNGVFNFGINDFTVEWWEFRTNPAGSSCAMARDSESVYSPFLLAYESGSQTYCYITSNGSTWDIANAQPFGPVPNLDWAHKAISRQDNTFRTFYNGAIQAQWTSSLGILASGGNLSIGRSQAGAHFFGTIDEVRISNIARYTAAFTPPSAPFTAD